MPRLLRILGLALLVAGCERAAGPGPCPGDPQARLQLRATLVEGANCAAAAALAGALTIPVAIAYPATGEAALCPERSLAEPLLGARDGDALDVAAPARPTSLAGCSCALQVVERVTGTVARDASGGAIGFAGELVNDLAPAVGAASCTGGEACAAPCRIRWTLAAP